MSAFFRIGVIYADFIPEGTTPCSSDQQISRLRNGASRPTFSLSSHVGSGSDEHCLPGSDRTISITSDCVMRMRWALAHPTFTPGVEHVQWASACLLRWRRLAVVCWRADLTARIAPRNGELRRSSASRGSTNAGDLVVEELVKDGGVNLSGRILCI